MRADHKFKYLKEDSVDLVGNNIRKRVKLLFATSLGQDVFDPVGH